MRLCAHKFDIISTIKVMDFQTKTLKSTDMTFKCKRCGCEQVVVWPEQHKEIERPM